MARATSLELDGRLVVSFFLSYDHHSVAFLKIEAKPSVPKDKMDRRIFVGGLPPDLSPGLSI